MTEAADGWTLVGQPGNLSAQFEHTIIVTKGAPIVATLAAAYLSRAVANHGYHRCIER